MQLSTVENTNRQRHWLKVEEKISPQFPMDKADTQQGTSTDKVYPRDKRNHSHFRKALPALQRARCGVTKEEPQAAFTLSSDSDLMGQQNQS